MDSSIAQMTCVLKVNVKCEACRKKIHSVLQNIYGVYKINIDADQGTVKVSGKVNPSSILTVLEGSGKHAELKSITFDGEVKDWGDEYSGESRYGSYGSYGYGYDPYAAAPYPYPPLGRFDYPWHDPGRLIMMPPSPPSLLPPPPPLLLPSSSRAEQSQLSMPPQIQSQSQSQSLPPQPPSLPAPSAGNDAMMEVKSEARSGKKSKCTIM